MKLQEIQQRLYCGMTAIMPSTYKAFNDALTAALKADIDWSDMDIMTPSKLSVENGITVIPVSGVLLKGVGFPEEVCQLLGICDIDFITDSLRIAQTDPNIETIILDFNTGGGEVTGIYELGKLIEETGKTKNLIGYTSTYDFSAGYWLTSKCNEFYMAPTSWAGSVGVCCERYDVSESNKAEGIKVTPFASSPKKFWNDPNYPMSDDEKAWIEQNIVNTTKLFQSEVLSNRDINPELLNADIFIGNDCIKNNFCDGLFNSLYDLKAALITQSQSSK